MSNLLSIDRWHFFLSTSCSLLFLSRVVFFFWRCVLSNLTCNRSVVLRYFTVSVWGMIVCLILTAGQWPFRRVNVMCDDLDSLTLIFHFFSHFSMTCKCSWRLSEVIVGSSWVAILLCRRTNNENKLCQINSKNCYLFCEDRKIIKGHQIKSQSEA